MKECTTPKLAGLSVVLRCAVALTASVALPMVQSAAAAAHEHQSSTAEQVAVYKAFMSYFAARTPNAQVADATLPLSLANAGQCMHGIKLEKKDAPSMDQRTLSQEIISAPDRFKLVPIRPGSQHHERLLQLSEIAFDARHQYAVLNYDFRCGVLCGKGATVVFKKLQGGWKHIRSCENWIS